jgi:hypothetical protein
VQRSRWGTCNGRSSRAIAHVRGTKRRSGAMEQAAAIHPHWPAASLGCAEAATPTLSHRPQNLALPIMTKRLGIAARPRSVCARTHHPSCHERSLAAPFMAQRQLEDRFPLPRTGWAAPMTARFGLGAGCWENLGPAVVDHCPDGEMPLVGSEQDRRLTTGFGHALTIGRFSAVAGGRQRLPPLPSVAQRTRQAEQ